MGPPQAADPASPDPASPDLGTPELLPDFSALILDGEGGARPVSAEDLKDEDIRQNSFAFVWVHLARDAPGGREWLEQSGLDRFVVEALTADDTRPRCTVHGDGAIVNLRGLNLNPGAEPEDMISARFWIEEKRAVGVWIRPLMAVRDLFDAIERKQGPKSPGDLIAKLALRIADRAGPVIAGLNEKVDDMEEMVLDEQATQTRADLARIRRMAIIIRRFMLPQRDALTTLEIEDLAWLTERDRSRLREAGDRITLLGEELDAIRDRASVINDQIVDLRAEMMNRHTLVLAVVAAVFLPLGLLTGLLGINVGGIPGSDNPYAFLVVTALLVVLGGLQWWLFKRLKIL